MSHRLRNPALIAGLTQKVRESLLMLAILICLPAWSIPPTITLPRERTWTPGPVYMQIGHSCVG